MSSGPVAVISGSGRLPFLVTEGIHRAGRQATVLAIRGMAEPGLKAMADDYVKVGLVRLGGWIRAMKRRGISEAVLIGGVKKREMYKRFRWLSYVPDWKTLRLWYDRSNKEDYRDQSLLMLLVKVLGEEGIELVSSAKYCEEHLASEGVMTKTAVPARAAADVEFGWRIARASADLDIGQSLAVKEEDIIAVEAVEGTDAMIRRAGELCRKGKWTMIKVARPNQDMRLDVPTIGPDTLRHLKDAKCVCLVVEAEKTLIVDKPDTLALADELGIAVMGRRAEAAALPDEPS